jgi:hypothetical protein
MGLSLVDTLIQQLLRNRVRELRIEASFVDRQEAGSLARLNEIGARILEVEYLAAQFYGHEFAESI